MPLDSYVSVPPPLSVDTAALAKASPSVQKAARWFWWIAGLSVINSAVALGGGNFNFVVGLGITQFADGLFLNLKVLAVVFDLLVVAFFFLAGLFAQKGQLWAFIVGGVAYVADGAIFAFFGDWLPVAFHVYALVFIFIGAKELQGLIKKAGTPFAPEAVSAPPVSPLIVTEPPQA